jgi:hypothetical protein
MSVLLVLCALLIVAGGVSLLAAAMGNPVRIGALRMPGPEGAVERAVIGVIGAVCVAAILPVVLMNSGPREPYAVADATDSPQPSPGASRTAEPSPTPPVGPSAVVATPGVPTVTSIAIGQDSATGCVRTFSATVRISAGPVTVRYRVYVNGAIVGEPNRSKSISGTGARLLDNVAVTATHSGAWTVRVDVLAPNPGILTGTAVWSAPAACNPAPPPTTPPPPPPTLSLSDLSVTGPAPTDACTNAPISVSATLTVGSAPTGLDVTYSVVVGAEPAVTDTVHVTSPISTGKVVVLPIATPGSVTVTFSASAPGATTPTPLSKDFTITCT